MTTAAVTIAVDRQGTKAGLTVGGLAAGLLGLFALDNLLLLHFWGLSLPLTAGLVFVAGIGLAALCARLPAVSPRVPYRVLAIALLVALALFALGGEGRFFYANPDWQIRDAVLRDMALNPWPFAYDIGGTAYFLRAPLGTYLLPAMFGANAEIALLLFNALRMALLLTLGWHLFETRRDRLIGLGVFIVFSGWDLLGTALYWGLGGDLSWDHLEAWNFGRQYSSHVTQAFWVPQHAIAGWTGALTFLLWRKGVLPIGIFAASIPLVAIWSPLAIIGTVPFAMLAGLEALKRQAFDAGDVALAALAAAIALPALLYLQLDAAKVGMHLLNTYPPVWAMCVALEVLPFTIPLLRDRQLVVTDRQVVRLVQFLLLAMPLIQVGAGADFQMRASIMPLALLSILFAQWICRLVEQRPLRKAALAYALLALALGAATPLAELRRAVMNRPSPRPLCSLIGAWHQQDNMIVPYASYLAPVSNLPAALRDVPVTAGRGDPPKCWRVAWVLPKGWPHRSKD